MPDHTVEVVVNVGAFPDAPADTIERAVQHCLADAGVGEGEVSVTLLDDAGIQQMNRDYLSRDRPTDVISFSLGDTGAVMGDVYVGVAEAERQARELGVDLDEELVRLAIHGTLHVLGHDHPEGLGRSESTMFALQERLLAQVFGRDSDPQPPGSS